MKKRSKAGAGLLAAMMLTAAMAPAAFAEPSASMQEVNSDTAITEFSLMIDDSQLKVTAPTTVVMYMNGDGTFTAPDNAYIENGSIFDVAVATYQVEGTSTGFTGAASATFETDAASLSDMYWLTATPTVAESTGGTAGTAIDIAAIAGVNDSAVALNADWNMAENDGVEGNYGADCIKLKFDGAAANVTTDEFIGNASSLVKVTWTFASGAN